MTIAEMCAEAIEIMTHADLCRELGEITDRECAEIKEAVRLDIGYQMEYISQGREAESRMK